MLLIKLIILSSLTSLIQQFSNSALTTSSGHLSYHQITFKFTCSLEEDGIYLVASSSLFNRPDALRRILNEAFHVEEIINDDGSHLFGDMDVVGHEFNEASTYLATKYIHSLTDRKSVV